MSKEFVGHAYLLIDGTEVKCEEISYELQEDGDGTVMTMNKANRADGHTGGVITAELSMTIPEPQEGLPVDLDAIRAAKTLFATVIEFEGGAIKTFRDCKITSMSVSARQGDKVTRSVSARALRFSFD